MKILFFTQYFWPENFRINELVEEFNSKDNTVLTSYPSYPSYKNFKDFKKSKDQIYSNSKIIRVPVFGRSSNNISIILNYITFLIMSFFILFLHFLKKRI